MNIKDTRPCFLKTNGFTILCFIFAFSLGFILPKLQNKEDIMKKYSQPAIKEELEELKKKCLK